MEKIGNFINGNIEFGNLKCENVLSPNSGDIVAEVCFSTKEDFDNAIDKINSAKDNWKNLTYKKRTEVIFNLRILLKENKDKLIDIICLENGKNKEEANAEVLKAIELCDFAVSIPSLISGKCQFVSEGIEVREFVQPLGIIGCITPFNFPLMVPMWTIPNILVCGNAMIIKPSEKTPSLLIFLANLLKQAGLPDGIFNVIQGGKEIVEAMCDNIYIDCVTFVGSSPIAKLVYKRATSNLKRCLSLGGAKNHIIVTNEVDPIITAKEIIASAYGMSGQRCMAASTLLTVGNCDKLIEEIVNHSKKINSECNLNPLISKEAVNNVYNFLSNTKGNILVDGREFKSNSKGFFVGASVISYECYDDMEVNEVFAPTIEIVKCETLKEAIDYQNKSPYANGASIYTDIGENALKASTSLSSGMIGVNIGVPVPRDPFSFGGLKISKFGVGDITGYNSIQLFTVCKKITTKWNSNHKKDWMS